MKRYPIYLISFPDSSKHWLILMHLQPTIQSLTSHWVDTEQLELERKKLKNEGLPMTPMNNPQHTNITHLFLSLLLCFPSTLLLVPAIYLIVEVLRKLLVLHENCKEPVKQHWLTKQTNKHTHTHTHTQCTHTPSLRSQSICRYISMYALAELWMDGCVCVYVCVCVCADKTGLIISADHKLQLLWPSHRNWAERCATPTWHTWTNNKMKTCTHLQTFA